MDSILDILNARFAEALAAAARLSSPKSGAPGADPQIRPAGRPEFGDYQANFAMQLARCLHPGASRGTLGVKPRDLAARVVAAADLDDVCAKVEIAGPGFVNLHLAPAFVAKQLEAVPPAPPDAGDDRLGIPRIERPQTAVVDYSSPNLAKEMHVGHLRSTVIGDAIARISEFEGNRVIRQSHVGDWGTQFGMLLVHLKELLAKDPDGHQAELDLSDLEEFYRAAKQRFDSDPSFADAARQEVVLLQAGDPPTVDIWQRYREVSLQHCQAVCERLGVTLTRQDVRGESAYNDDLPGVVDELRSDGVLSADQGAQCVFLKGFKGKEGKPLPLIVQKTDGGYLYATTDLAALRYRVRTLGADWIIYLTDARQKLHLEMVFAAARAAGWTTKTDGTEVRLDHVAFGSVLGPDRKPFKTRSGENVKLADLLDEAESRARAVVDANSPDLPDDERRKIATAVGIGAVKYADLSSNLASDYVFNWDRMLAMEGNTAPYMMYAYARVRSIYRKAAQRLGDAETAAAATAAIHLPTPWEQALGKKLLQLPDVLRQVAADLQPHVLCTCLFELSKAFSAFYTHCPVLQADSDELRASRLRLCDLTARAIRLGLSLLGIQTIDRM